MKNSNKIMMVLVALLVACPAMAQNYVGVMGGLNISNIDVDAPDADFDYVTKYGFGGVVGVKLYKNLTLHLEPMYLKSGAKEEGFDASLGNFTGRFNTTTLTVPAFLKLDIGSSAVQPYVMAGPCVSLNLDSELGFETQVADLKGDASGITRDIDFALGLGGGLSYAIGNSSFFVEARYLHGLVNVTDGGTIEVKSGDLSLELEVEENDVTTRGFQFMTGVTFPFGL